MSVEIDGIDEIIRDMGKANQKLVSKMKPLMSKTALSVKKRMQADLRKSRYFKSVARSVSYDLAQTTWDGTGVFQFEVGPDRSVSPSASLAGIAYFGGSNGGGGTVRDPIIPAREELPVFVGYCEMIAGGILD